MPPAHLFPHVPQLFESIVTSAQAPLQINATSVPLAWQVQTLLVQSAPAGHCFPHAPQFCGSVVVLRHVMTPATGHIVVLPLQVHRPASGVPEGWQPTPAAHTLPQPPQLVGSK